MNFVAKIKDFFSLRKKVEKNPRKYLGQYICQKIGKYGYIGDIKGEDSTYHIWIVNGSTNCIDTIAEKEMKERVNLKVVRNEDGSIKYNRVMSPFSGRFYDVAAHTCDAIPLGIRSLTPVSQAPDDLINTLVEDLDKYINVNKRIKRIKK